MIEQPEIKELTDIQKIAAIDRLRRVIHAMGQPPETILSMLERAKIPWERVESESGDKLVVNWDDLLEGEKRIQEEGSIAARVYNGVETFKPPTRPVSTPAQGVSPFETEQKMINLIRGQAQELKNVMDQMKPEIFGEAEPNGEAEPKPSEPEPSEPQREIAEKPSGKHALDDDWEDYAKGVNG